MVVRAGLTTCIKPAERNDNECSSESGVPLCNQGFVCSHSTYTCLKLCKLIVGQSEDPTECPTGTFCQTNNDVPSGWGVCGYQAPLVN
jgi:hypothetical protein